MQNLTKTQNTIILVALENFLALEGYYYHYYRLRKVFRGDLIRPSQPEFKAQVAELVELYNNIT